MTVSSVTAAPVYSQQDHQVLTTYRKTINPPVSPHPSALMFGLFNNLDSISPCDKFIPSLWFIALISALQDAPGVSIRHNKQRMRGCAHISIYTQVQSDKSNNSGIVETSFIAYKSIDFSIFLLRPKQNLTLAASGICSQHTHLSSKFNVDKSNGYFIKNNLYSAPNIAILSCLHMSYLYIYLNWRFLHIQKLGYIK